MSLQEFIQNTTLKDCFNCQILWSSENFPSKGTPQGLLVEFKPVNYETRNDNLTYKLQSHHLLGGQRIQKV